MRARSRALVAGVLALCAAQAHAHGSFKGVNDFYAGLLHPLTTPEHILPFVALGLLAGLQGPRAYPLALVFPFALVFGGMAAFAFPAPAAVTLVNVASAIVLGALVALARPLPRWFLYGLALLFGCTHGLANGEALASGAVKWYVFLPGVFVAGLAITVYCMATVEWLSRFEKPWIRIAVRVAGSWIAAIGILVLAWQLRLMIRG